MPDSRGVEDLDPFCAGEQGDTGGQHVTSQAPSLIVVLRARRLNETRRGHRVVPEQPVRRHVVVLIVHHEVEVGAIERSLSEALFRVGVDGVRSWSCGADGLFTEDVKVLPVGDCRFRRFR